MSLRAKRGDTLTLSCVRENAAGAPVSIAGLTIAAQLRRGAAVIDLDAAPTNAVAGEFTLSKDAVSAEAWEVGLYNCDVEFRSGGVVRSTDTFVVEVVEDITRAA